ncbi:hypothetical protein AGMMS50276_27060 [Synergistales bacterium]|nr:hypothetical protein AGMMS50276_27060 [Synergistales bacterium]
MEMERELQKNFHELLNQQYSFCEMFLNYSQKGVAIWFSGQITETVMITSDLTQHNVRVKYFIMDGVHDVSLKAEYGIEKIEYKKLTLNHDIDFIVTVTEDDRERAFGLLLGKTDAEIVSLEDLVRLFLLKYTIILQYTNELTKHPVNVYLLLMADTTNFEHKNRYQEHLRTHIPDQIMRINPPFLSPLYEEIKGFSPTYVNDIFTSQAPFTEDGIVRFPDYTSDFRNIIAGDRLTLDSPADYEHTIHVFGTCWGFGFGTDDGGTISTYLQRYINRYCVSSNAGKWRVVNHGVHAIQGGLKMHEVGQQTIIRIQRGEVKPDDIVVEMLPGSFHVCPWKKQIKTWQYLDSFISGIPRLKCFDVLPVLQKAHEVEKIFVNGGHFNHRGNDAVARMLFEKHFWDIIDLAPAASEEMPKETLPAREALPMELPWRWRELSASGHSPAEFFAERGRDIALYIDGESRERDEMVDEMVRELESLGVAIKFRVADQTDKALSKKSDVDFILDMTDRTPDLLVKMLERKTGAEVVRLDELLRAVHDKYFLFRRFSDILDNLGLGHLKTRTCVLGWARLSEIGLDPVSLILRIYAPIPELKTNPKYFTSIYGDLPTYNAQYIKEIFSFCDYRPEFPTDRAGKFLNILNGERVTPGAPEGYEKTIHIFGGTAAFGVGTDDNNTLGALIQAELNVHKRSDGKAPPVRVLNHGDPIHERVYAEKAAEDMKRAGIAEGDISLVVLHPGFHKSKGSEQKKMLAYIDGYVKELGLSYIDLTAALRLAENKTAYMYNDYVNHRGYRSVAERVFMSFLKGAVEA